MPDHPQFRPGREHDEFIGSRLPHVDQREHELLDALSAARESGDQKTIDIAAQNLTIFHIDKELSRRSANTADLPSTDRPRQKQKTVEPMREGEDPLDYLIRQLNVLYETARQLINALPLPERKSFSVRVGIIHHQVTEYMAESEKDRPSREFQTMKLTGWVYRCQEIIAEIRQKTGEAALPLTPDTSQPTPPSTSRPAEQREPTDSVGAALNEFIERRSEANDFLHRLTPEEGEPFHQQIQILRVEMDGFNDHPKRAEFTDHQRIKMYLDWAARYKAITEAMRKLRQS